MKCTNCGKSGGVLHRTAPYGEYGKWMCMACIEAKEPELARNIKEDEDFQLIKDLTV